MVLQILAHPCSYSDECIKNLRNAMKQLRCRCLFTRLLKFSSSRCVRSSHGLFICVGLECVDETP